MPSLPARPDPGQLRHQAKDLLHAARRGEPDAITRIRAVSDRVILSSAQLALAREYGFTSWAKLQLEVRRRDVLNRRDLTGLTELLGEHPELAVTNLERSCDHPRGTGPVGYMAMLRFNAGLLGVTGDVSGTGAVTRALIEAGAPVDGDPGDQETPLITAASYGDVEVAAALIDAGADLDAMSAPDSGGVPGGTALAHAAVFGMTGVLDLLVAAGAQVDSVEMAAAAGDVSRWPLARCTVQSRIRALVFAADHERLEVIDRLAAAGTPVNEPDAEWGRLPLHTAAAGGRTASVRRLLAHGCDPDRRDPVRGHTALEAGAGHEEVAALLRPITGRPASRRPGADAVGIQIRIEASDLPGRDCGPSADRPEGYRNVHVGVQRRNRRDELLELRPGDAATASWVFPATAAPTAAGIDITGPYVQGRPGGRFIYLSWGTVDEAGVFTMFRRAKLMLDAVDPTTLEAARRYGRLIARLTLTDANGHPLCAAVRPPAITWTASPAS